MSEKKGPFDAAIKILFGHTDYGAGTIGEVKGRSCEAAIRVLEEWPKWEPLIEAAGKVDKEGGLKFIHACGYPNFPYPKNARQIRALLESLPEKEE